jgi:hypothetical protein
VKPRALALLALAGCILPDREITIVNEETDNKNAVRILDPVEVTPQLDAACQEVSDGALEQCPQPGYSADIALPYYLDPERFVFCSCDPGQQSTTDQGSYIAYRLPATTLRIEDRDKKGREKDLDEIYAALQLDLRPGDPDPAAAVAYVNFVNPSVPLPISDGDYDPLGREELTLRELALGDTEVRIDLCNDARAEPLARGYHTLRVVVTDRKWFVRTAGDDDETEVLQPGVPDLAGGATYDMRTYVFHCWDRVVDEDRCRELCVDPEGV